MVKKILLYLLVLLLLADLSYSFMQHYNMPLDGDLGCCIIPAKSIEPVLESPLGIQVFTKGESYANPNRFFSHYAIYTYFRSVPFFFQQFTNPIDAAYLSCALAKTLMQLSIIVLLSLATGIAIDKQYKYRFLLSAALITPLFQTNGYYISMGIIDQSTSYAFFYALPLALLLLYFYPFYRQEYGCNKKNLSISVKIFWIPLALICCLSGPLNPGIALVASAILFVQIICKKIKENPDGRLFQRIIVTPKRIPSNYYFFLLPISIFSLYSLYLGRYNYHNTLYDEPLLSLFTKLPEGVITQITRKQGLPVLLIFIVINYLIIRFGIKSAEGKRLRKTYTFVILFSLLYIALLPFGGYREYRPLVLRYDTFMPVTIALVYLFGATTLFVLHKTARKLQIGYSLLVVVVVVVFINADKSNFGRTDCERQAIAQIASSPEETVRITDECLVIDWKKINNPEDSRLHVQMLQLWGIVKDNKLYYQATGDEYSDANNK